MRSEEHHCACRRVGFREGEEDCFDEGVVLRVVEEEVGEDQEGENICINIYLSSSSLWMGGGSSSKGII